MPLEEPAVVVALGEGPDHSSGLLERPNEALRDAVALRLAHVGRRGADAEPSDLGLELPCPVLRAPVVPKAET